MGRPPGGPCGVCSEGGLSKSTDLMTDTRKSLYLSTAIPFVNARPHLGFALELCIADALARHARARGRPVCFLTSAQAERVHVIGKGITRFHALIWPAILSSAGVAGPTHLLVHGYLTQSGAKISKSGVPLDPAPLIETFGADALRYYLLRHVRTTRDGDFDHARLVHAYNAELANNLGNLVNRVLGLVQRGCGGVIPRHHPSAVGSPAAELEQRAVTLPSAIDSALDRFAIDEALDTIFSLISDCNRFIDHTAPWTALKNGDTVSAEGVLRSVLETLRVIACELASFLPQTSARLSSTLGVAETSAEPCLDKFYQLHEGTALPRSLQLFPRYEVSIQDDV